MLRIPYILRRLQSLPFFWHSVYVTLELLMTFREAEVRCCESAAAAKQWQEVREEKRCFESSGAKNEW